MSEYRDATGKLGDKLRCRYCHRMLTLLEDVKLDDGTQTYQWKGADGQRKCGSTRHSGVYHRAPEKRARKNPRKVATQG